MNRLTERKNPAGLNYKTMHRPHYFEVYDIIVAHPMGITVREIRGLMPEEVTSTQVGCICQHLSEIGVIENKGKILNGTGGRICVWRAR